MRLVFLHRIFILFFIVLCTSEITLAQKSKSILLSNATVLDGRAGVKPYQASILIENGIIRKISKNPIQVSSEVEVLDCSNKFVSLGLFDAHIHLATIDLSDINKAKASTDLILENMIRHGITSLRDMAGNAPYIIDYKKDIANGVKIGPDVFYAAQFAGPDYFKMFSNGGKIKLGVFPWERAITDTTDIVKVVKEAKAFGVTGIKTYAELPWEQMQKIVKAAKKEGMQVWSHATVFPIKPMDAINLSVHSISHAADVIFEQIPADSLDISYAWQKVYKGMQIDPATMQGVFQAMKKNKVYFDPTVFHASNNKLHYAAEITRLAHAAGVKIVAGTDWIYPEENKMVPLYDEVLLYQNKGGMTALEVLETLTYNAALVTGLKDRGYIAKGKRADILILDKDPLQDIVNFFKPERVIQAGKIVF